MRRALAALTVAAVTAVPGRAQVGHPPQRSPYRDIVRSQTLSAAVGYLSGSRGAVPVGPSSGFTLGARYELRLSGPTDLQVTLARVAADRFVVDPLAAPEDRQSGPVGQSLVLADVGLMFLLTGAKTWHGVAPYVGAAFGLALASSTPQDSSGYEFGTKFTLQPSVGVRYYAGESVYLRLEVRDAVWRLRFPLSYREPSALRPNDPPVLPPTAGETDWTHHLWVSVGVGIAFRL